MNYIDIGKIVEINAGTKESKVAIVRYVIKADGYAEATYYVSTLNDYGFFSDKLETYSGLVVSEAPLSVIIDFNEKKQEVQVGDLVVSDTYVEGVGDVIHYGKVEEVRVTPRVNQDDEVDYLLKLIDNSGKLSGQQAFFNNIQTVIKKVPIEEITDVLLSRSEETILTNLKNLRDS